MGRGTRGWRARGGARVRFGDRPPRRIFKEKREVRTNPPGVFCGTGPPLPGVLCRLTPPNSSYAPLSASRMAEYALQRRKQRSPKATETMLIDVLLYGNHKYRNHVPQLVVPSDARRLVKRLGLDLKTLVRQNRTDRPIPHFENLLLDSRMWVNSAGVKLVRRETGATVVESAGPGEIVISSYQAAFEDAQKALDRAIESRSSASALEAVASGASALEAYLHHRIDLWCEAGEARDKLADEKKALRFDEKVADVVPMLCGGRPLKKARNWSDYKTLMRLRNNKKVHPKLVSYGVSLDDVADSLNLFRTGIVGLLVDLHIHFSEPVPVRIIRAQYAPMVDVVIV